jgi:tetraacyldisaccharide 4'-kinase
VSLEHDWFESSPTLGGRFRRVLLLPLTALFVLLSGLRRRLFRIGLLPVTRLPVPVVVVGNLVAGGAGKTPLTLCLAETFRQRGWHPGIVSRGYGGAGQVLPVLPGASAREVGDEPLLLARRSACPVFVGRQRAVAAQALLAANPEVDLILCDDGLQHYALWRDVEIAVIDRRGIGNGWRLPAGPLREPASRLAEVTAVVAHGIDLTAAGLAVAGVPAYAMSLRPGQFVSLTDPAKVAQAEDFLGQKLFAIAGIGEPQRFFDTLNALGLDAETRAFPDHHVFSADDLDFARGGALLMTEKDAVKCVGLSAGEAWFLPVSADLTPDLATLIVEKLDGRKAA